MICKQQHHYSSSGGDDIITTTDKKSSMMILNFNGETVITSDVAPPPIDGNKSLSEFFQLPYAAPMILRGSKDNQVNEIELDDELFTQYKQNCDTVGASPPTSNCKIFDVTTSGVRFPGLEVMSVVTIGVMVITDLPEYELVLIRDSTYAKGNKLFVWFFNKVTGKDKSGKDETSSSENSQTTFSFNRISTVPKGDGIIAFQANANLSLLIKFPAILMKAIPGASQDKFEKQGSASLVKALEDDLPAALELFRQEYVRWLEK